MERNATDAWLSHFPTLKKLSLRANSKVSCLGLASLTHLADLNISFTTNRIRLDVFFALTTITKLTSLDLSFRGPSLQEIPNSAGFHSQMRSMTRLDHEGDNASTQVSVDFSPSQVMSLSQLRTLNLAKSRCPTDAHLRCLTNLTSLDLDTNLLITNSSVSLLTSLNSLDLSSNHLISGKVLTTLTNLTSLSLAQNRKIDGSVLRHLVNLTHLCLNSNEKVALSHLEPLTSLTSLVLQAYQDFSCNHTRRSLTNLTHLDLHQTPLEKDLLMNHTRLVRLNTYEGKLIVIRNRV